MAHGGSAEALKEEKLRFVLKMEKMNNKKNECFLCNNVAALLPFGPDIAL